jgi:proline iminopeptidase
LPALLRARFRRWAWAPLLLALAGSCRTDGDYFFVERNGAVMPIWVRGEVDSGTFALMVHGGPGDSAQWFVDSAAFQALEKRYAVAYWDQRRSGTSQGDPPPGSFTVDEVLADMDAVTAALRARFPVKRLFLVGHSWGGFLATAWLVDPARQAAADGYVMVDGAFDLARGFELARQFVILYAQEQLASGADVEAWTAALAWASSMEHGTWNKEALARLHGYVSAAHGDYWHEEADQSPSFERLFLSPLDAFAYLRNASEALDFYDLNGLDLTTQMAAIRTPTLITWGRHDGILPVAQAQEAFEALGTDPTSKSVVVFEDSAHEPMTEEPAAWVEAVTTFVDHP